MLMHLSLNTRLTAMIDTTVETKGMHVYVLLVHDQKEGFGRCLLSAFMVSSDGINIDK